MNTNNSFLIGKDESLQLGDRGHSHAIVMSLLEGLEGKGHHVFTDNYYSSPALFAELREKGFGACGTVRVNRRGIPAAMKQPMGKGEVATAWVDESMMALKWVDKRPVSMLSTIHDDRMMTKVRRTRRADGGQEEIRKPVVIEEYNKYMGGVDRSDQLLSYYGFPHRTLKWWKRALFHLLDMAVVNAYVLYTVSTSASLKKLTHEQFRVEIAKQLLLQSSVDVSEDVPVTHGRLHRPQPPQSRLTERHFPDHLPCTKSGKRGQTECTVCSKKKGRGRKTTSYMCKECKLPMCIIPCFELYHTKVNPQRYL